MFPLHKNRKDNPESVGFAVGAEHDGPRIVLSSDGKLVYATPDLTTAPHDDPLMFQFDWITGADRRMYLVGAAVAEDPSHADAADAFMDLSSDAMLVLNAQGLVTKANQAFFAALGYPRDVLGRRAFVDLFQESERPTIRSNLQMLHCAGDDDKTPCRGADFEGRMMTADNRILRMQWQPFKIGALYYCIGRDVSATKAQEKALERREKQLEEAESIARMGHWHWTIGQQRFEWSAEIYRIFGLDPKEFSPDFHALAARVHKHDRDRVNQAFQRAIIEQNDYDMEFRILRPEGEVRYIRCEGRCARDSSGEVTALYGIMQDMTERVAQEIALRDAKDAAERAYNAKSQFLANMSHELRTPLNAIIGFSEMMQRQLLGPIGTEKYLEYIAGIRESGEHLLDLITDILDMSKIEAGKYELDLEEVPVAKTIGLALHMMEGRGLESGVKICALKDVAQDLHIIADRRAVMQIMLNLLSNAVKFSRQGGEVQVTCQAREDDIVLKVIDHGIGIPPNKLATITRPFEQVSASYTREHEGSGLGLAITKELVEMHGGSMSIDSVLGHGTSVTIRLPFDASKAGKKSKKVTA